MSTRYGCLPSDIKNLSINDFCFNLLVLSKGLQQDQKIAEKKAKFEKGQLDKIRAGRRYR